ncbi:basic amino acid ABC transporter substrate-binding protein [Streptomyces gobiensis]|uniref:basic amino acid ABC transporter substrate-binding protein n=1 Tax=Streptomyces gobiensis TaxID=2875706 RepID=UPI001E2FD55C|nr:basic amino acid ABC transporter substrate-binding protein [Streptomyces gobiensis]UGY93396.1 basic amino acid ABC transporter substrate-binding protein [Streptomyces gobiensis]
MSSRKPLPLIAAAASVALLATACSSTKATGEGGDEVRLVSSGKLITCTHLPYPPFQFKEGKKIVGFDVDLIDLVAEELNAKQEIVDTPFEGIQSGEDLNARKCDLAAAGMTITEVREENLDFSDPYFAATQALITKKGAPYGSLADLKGKKLGVQQSTTGEEYAKKEAKGVTTVQYEDLALLLTAVKTGKIAAGINDNGVLFDYVKQNPDTEVQAEFDTGEEYGFAVQTGNDALRKKINEVLTAAKDDGRYDKIYKKWFGTEPKK